MQKQEIEIDIKELFSSLLQQKWLIIIVTGIFAIASILFAISQPNIYQAEVLLAPVAEESQMSGAASQLGGIAAIAGINIGGGQGATRVDLALETLKSRTFTNHFIEERNILVPLMATEEWNKTSGKVIIDPTLYDEATSTWVRTVEEGKSIVPTAWEAYKEFTLIVDFEQDKTNGFIRLTVQSQSPILAQEWASWLVDDINLWIKKEDIREFKANISYIQKKLIETNISEMQKVFYQLIEEQTKKLMLAEVQEEYVFKTIDPAVIPEEKSEPSRALICILGTFLGGFFALFIALIRHILLRK
ncbi:LPS biosynthesis protein [Shewanella sairae]|uniref:LPS biosynthesis protein n=1 Tax=Shewanella sairae TaxID=190310 RepID=A0ABQ4PN97_9GAMM|nr:Wzz/FepE/Etk N-terminal domain-containing protein [Shewanella sairae]MCL1131419.1 Wzz/FepE/Etk N-terminal domain-containing protein [Shewanella sairae]GIU49904.1 LPS biosynthesis protein [Shewanella sairae]